MDEKRKGEIAYTLLKNRTIEDIRLKDLTDLSRIKRNAGNIAKATDIPVQEIVAFTKIVLKEILLEQIKQVEGL